MAEHGFEYVKELGKCLVTDVLWPPFKRHVDYWLCCPENIQGLTDETRLLKRAKLDVDQKKEEARYRAEIVAPHVEIWSNEATQKLEVSERISQRYNELKPWDIFPWYSLGKSAKRTAQGVLKLRNEADSMMISFPAPPASMRSFSHEPTEKLESRRRVEEHIVESLNDDRIRMIAICGLGGVGKTTMVQKIEERVRKERLFDEVVSVDVGQRIDIPNIQKEIAEILGLKLGDDDTLPGRAHKIHTRLLGRTRKLLIFDNVWKSFNLKHLGVPFGNGFEACKIILASRSRDVCEDMDAQKVVQIDVLDEEEAWRLFREKSGECVDKPELHPIAKSVAAKCRGLPIAIVTIGKALKNRRIETWSDSLSQLIRANSTNFPEVKNVYEMLKLSYDLLEMKVKSPFSCFVACFLMVIAFLLSS